jgi:hypothetical protein
MLLTIGMIVDSYHNRIVPYPINAILPFVPAINCMICSAALGIIAYTIYDDPKYVWRQLQLNFKGKPQ